MTSLMALVLWLFCLFVLYKMWREYAAGRDELLTIRNLFLLGFLLFIPSSAALGLWTRQVVNYPVQDWEATGIKFVLWMFSFYLVFEGTYRFSRPLTQVVKCIPSPQRIIPDYALIALALIFLAIRSVLPYIPLGGFASQILNPAMSSFQIAAAAIASWVLVGRWRNPIYLTVGVLIFGTIMLDIALLTFSRRPILSVGMALVWVAYYRVLRYQSPRVVLVKVLPYVMIAAIGLMFVTGTRSSLTRGLDVAEERRAELDLVPQLKKGFYKVIGGQETGGACMWALETWPDKEEVRPLLSLQYFFFYPVPRSIWKGKPYGLAYLVPYYIGHPGAGYGLTMPPGVIGYAAAEGGYFVLLIYGVAFGLLIGLIDHYLRVNVQSILGVIPLGIALGHIMGMTRGSLASFSFLYLQESFVIWIVIYVMIRLFGKNPQQRLGNFPGLWSQRLTLTGNARQTRP